MKDAPRDIVWGDFDERSPSGLCFTSGTTGAPKGVTYTHRANYLHTLKLLQTDVTAITARDTVMPVVPMFHANAWGLPFACPAVGAKLVLPGRQADGASLARLIAEEGVTIAVGVPTVWLGLMDHLGIQRFGVIGFCISGPMILNLIKNAPERVVAAAMMQPSGYRPELPDLFYQNNMEGWGPPLCEQRADLTMDMVSDFLTSMYTDHPGFVFSVTRDFVSSMQTPLLIAPDDVPSHPYKMAMEVADLAPSAEVTIYPWKDSQERIDEVVEHARQFLKAHVPVTA
jgi:hypothetical protein